MKHILIILIFCFPFLLSAQAVYDTMEIKQINDSTYRIRRTLIKADGSDEPKGTIIAKNETEVLNVAVNDVLEISRGYSNKLIELLKGLPFKSILNRYNEIERVIPDSSLFIKLNKLFPLDTGKYDVIDLRSNTKSIWTVSLNAEDQYYYVTTEAKSTEIIFITSDLHFRVGEVFDFIKVDDKSWMSLNGYLLKKK